MRRLVMPAVVGLFLSLALVSAQDDNDEAAQEAGQASQQTSEATVQVDESEEFGPHLANSEGFSLYIYTEDEQGGETSACGENCVRNWPPLTVDGEATAGEGVDEELIGTISREDGTTQVTYNGWPLYTYARDTEPSHIKGQRLGGVFFLVSPQGESLTEAVEQEGEEIPEEVMTQGGQAYATNCAACHGAQGQGQIGPRLAGNDNLEDEEFVVGRIIHGFPDHGMPPFGYLSDEQIAGISTYIRNSWENDFGLTTPEEVSEER